ncbi:MAG: sensor histidine kinase [Planctomycetota bacterium]|jgi:signal transduction histidine kinase
MVTLNVLAIDDEPGMRSGIERTVERLKLDVSDVGEQVTFDIKTRGSAEEGLEVVDEQVPDILLLDYKLPGMDGLELLNKINGRGLDMLTIMITAYASIETAVTATKKGAYDILPKPFTPADIKYTLKKAVTRILLARRAKQLEEEKKSVRFEFIRVLGHELKAPLGAVAGYLYMLRDEALGSEVKAYSNAVTRSISRLDQMQKLIVDLLDMTRIESGKKERSLVPVNLKTVADDAAALVETSAADRGITVKVDVPDNMEINADRGELDMIFNNLTSNAVKYNRDNGSVNLRVAKSDKVVTVEVADTGIGMSEDEMKKLFREFYRIRNDKTREVMGSGLGLSILRKLAELYDGEVNVDSKAGEGTTFTVILKEA